MTRGRLVVHAHFYQPLRVDPFSGAVPVEPAAAPFHDWNARIDAECYRPNVERGNLERISYDVGPTLASWMEAASPATYEGFIAGDHSPGARHGNAMAQSFHHTILPLASAADRRTEVRWGLRDFAHRFGRRAEGLWLPETAVDLATLRLLVDEGIRYTILAPWQASESHLDTRHPYRVELGGGRSIVVVFYDAGLSAAVSFDPAATADADRFARDRVAVRLADGPNPTDSPLVVLATDGELYGHHQQFRDLFLERLVAPGLDVPDRGFDVVELASAVLDRPLAGLPVTGIAERTSWSCHHGIARWSDHCPDAFDGRWKGPLRSALERLAAGIDGVTDLAFAALPGAPDRQTARDRYGDVVVGAEEPDGFAATCLGPNADEAERRRLLDLLEAQRWRLAMFASDAWFWDDPVRPETKQALRSAARAARLVDGIAGTSLERGFVADLALFRSPQTGLDGAALYREALSEIGRPGRVHP